MESISYDFAKANLLRIIRKKGLYCNDFIDSCENFDETKLAAKIYFYSKSHERTISDLKYKHAQNVKKLLIIKDLDEYHDYYLKSIVLLLA